MTRCPKLICLSTCHGAALRSVAEQTGWRPDVPAHPSALPTSNDSHGPPHGGRGSPHGRWGLKRPDPGTHAHRDR